MASGKSNNNLNSVANEIVNDIGSMISDLVSQGGKTTTNTIKVPVDSSEIDDALDKRKKLEKAMKKPIEGTVELNDSEIDKQIENAMKQNKPGRKPIQPTIDDIYNTEAMQKNITRLNKKLQTIYSKIYDPETGEALPGNKSLSRSDMESFSVNYQTLKLLSDYFKKDVPKIFHDLNDELYSFAKNQDDYKYYTDRVYPHGEQIQGFQRQGRVKKGEELPDIIVGEGIKKQYEFDFHKQAEQAFKYMVEEQKSVQSQAKQIVRNRQKTESMSRTSAAGVTHTTTVSEGQQTTTGNTGQQLDEVEAKARNAQRAVDDLSDSMSNVGKSGKSNGVAKQAEEISDSLERIKGKTHEAVSAISNMLGEGVSISGTQDYYDDTTEKIEKIKKEAKDLRDELKGLGVDQNDKVFGERFATDSRYLDTLDMEISMMESQVSDAYQEMVRNTEKAQQEAAEKIAKRNEDFIKKITSHEDFQKYGRKDWIDQYKEKLNEDSVDIDELYSDFEQKISDRKKMLQKYEQKNELRSFLSSQFKGKKQGKEYTAFLDMFKENFDAIENGGSATEEIIKVQERLSSGIEEAISNQKFNFTGKSFDELVNISNIKKGSDELNVALKESMEHLVGMYNAGNTESEEYYGTLYRIINLQKQMWKFNDGNGSGYDALAQSTKDTFNKQTEGKMRLQDSILEDLRKYSGIDSDTIDSALQIITDLKNNIDKPLFQPFEKGKPMSVDNFKKYYLDMLREKSNEYPVSSGGNIGDQIADSMRNARDEAEKTTAAIDDVVYHAGPISKLNKAETNGRFYGSNRGTGYFGTGHYFVDAATKHELMDDGNYSKLPFTSVDISKYDNLFDARNNNELAGKLHDFLQRLTRYTQGEDRYSIPELFGQFEDVFGKSVLNMNEFEARLSELKNYMQSSNMEDRNDSVSTQFMKSLGYGGVDTRVTRYADTRYGTVIYDLKEESILQANITDELEKQGDMLEKRNYASGEVWDQNEDKRIQGIIDEQKKRAEIQEEFKKIYDTDKGQKAEDDFDTAQNRLTEIDEIINRCTTSIENAEEELRTFYKDYNGLFGDDIMPEGEDFDKEVEEKRQGYRERIQELQEERAQIEAIIPALKEKYETEQNLAKQAWEQAKHNVEERYKPDESPISSGNVPPKRVAYHYGNISSGKPSHQFGDEISAWFTGQRNGGRAWADGTGTYVTSDASQYNRGDFSDPLKRFYAIDTSNLKLFEAHTEETAEQYYNFIHQLEQFCIKAGSGFDGFDTNLQNIDANSLYQTFQKVFPDIKLTFDEFNSFISDMTALVQESGLKADGSQNARQMFDFKKKNGADDIKTRFMKMLGFQGTDLSGTSFDTLRDGSVLFDTSNVKDNIIKTGQTIQDVMTQTQNSIRETSDAMTDLNTQSNETPVSTPDATPETEKQTEAEREQEEQARRTAEAEDERRTATERANDADTTPPPSDTGAKETADAAQSEAEGMEAVGKAAHEAAKAKEEFADANQRAAQSAKETADATREAADGINSEGNASKNASDNLLGDASQAPDKGRIIKTSYSDTKRSKTYSDEDGRTYETGFKLNRKTQEWEPFSQELTNYLSFEKDAIRVTNDLADAQLALSKAQNAASPDQNLIGNIRAYKKLLEDELDTINQQARDYADENEGYTLDLFNDRVTKETNKHQAKNDIKGAESFANAEKVKQKALEETDVLIERQQTQADLLRKKYTDAIKDTVSAQDYNDLEDLYADINTKMTNMKGRETTKLEREQLASMLKEYKQSIKDAQDKQKVSMEMKAFNPQSARQKLSTQFQSLMRDMKKSQADTTELEKELQKTIDDFEKSNEDTPAFFDTQNNIRRTIEQKFKNKQSQYNYDQFQIKQMDDSVSQFESSIERLVKAQTALDTATDKNDPALVKNLEDAKKAADEAFQSLVKVESVFDDGLLSDDAFDKLNMRKANAYRMYKDPQSSSYYRSAVNKANAKNTKTELNNYANAMRDYQSLYTKSLSSALSGDELQKMQTAMSVITQTESNWNNQKIVGIQLTEKQKEAVKQLQDAATSDDNKKGEYGVFTQQSLEKGAIQQKAIDAYNKMQQRLSKMYEQSDWRANQTEWNEQIRALEDRLETISLGDITNKDELEDALKTIREIATARQQLAKNSDVQPIGKDWQSKQHADLAKWMDQNKIAAKAFKDELEQLGKEIDEVGSKGGAEEWSSKFYKIQEDAANRGLLGKSLGDRFKDQFKNTMTSLATYYLSFQDFIRYGREAISIITELDTQLTEMRKVSDESLKTLQDYQLETFDIASRVGTTAAQIQASTADWMRLGEDLSQAKKSAEYSTLLLNVSEFSDINSATESLVAMSQAYQDIDKLDIIDKLNNIGNNFSISTSELASSLQLSAGTLKVAGNSLDEAIALTVAGNQVLQDPRKVGQSLRTISLRLTGTSVEDMQEAGEEIDGLISTQSKLRQVIMDTTKVSENGFKGFDILNDNGNYKSTYEILEGIAKVWKQIGEEDKKMGTNRQSFLLETIAGKTRAAAAASILDNFDTLQDVYKSSLDSYGSAQEELDKYLDSINGKVAQFKNRLQELASVSIDSSWIKAIVDFGSEALKIVTDLGKQFGGLNVIISGVIGAFLQFNGKGLLNFDKSLGKNVFNKDNAFSNIFSGFKNGIKNLFTKGSFGDEIFDSIFSGMGRNDKIYDVIEENVNKLEMPESFVNWFNGLDEDAQKAATLGDAIDAVGEKTFSLSNAFKTVGKIGGTVLSTIGSMAISMVAMFAFEAVVKGIYNFIHAEEIAIEKGREARKAISDINKEYDNQSNFVKENTDRYNELRKGIDISENGGIQNINLSEEEFQEFLSINNELANLFPSLVSGYDAQGNAILTLSSDADTATSSLQQLLEQERQLADFKVGEQLNDAVVGFATRYKQLQEDIIKQKQTIGAAQQLQTAVQEKTGDGIDLSKLGISIEGKNISYKFDQFDETQRGVADKIRQAYNEAAQGIGTVEWSGDYTITGELLGGLTYASEDQLDKFEEAFRARLAEMNLSDIPEEIINAMAVKNQDIQEIKADWNGLVPSILSQLNLYEDYQKLGDLKFGEQLQNIIANDISNIDFDNFEKIYGEGSWEDFGNNARGFVREHFLDPITSSLKDDDGNFKKESVNALNQLIDFDGSDLTNEVYIQQVNDIVDDITDDTEIQKTIKVLLGFEYYDENGNVHYDVTKRRDAIYEALGGYAGTDSVTGNKVHHSIDNGEKTLTIPWEKIKQLDQSQLEALEYAQKNMKVDLMDYNRDYDGLLKLIERAKEAMSESTDIPKSGVFSDIINDESYQAHVQGYEKSLSSLTSALETLRTEGSLTAEQMRDLQEEFPSMTDFSYDGISKFATKEISNWIGEFKSGWTDFSDEGQKQLDTYLANFTASYRKVAVAEEDAREEIQKTLINPNASYEQQKDQSQQYYDMVDALKSEYGEDLNWNIVLALKDQFSGDVKQLIAKYDEYSMVWNIEVDKEKLQEDIDNLTSQRSVSNARKSLIEAQGYEWGISDYEADNAISDQLIADYQQQIKDAEKQMEEVTDEEKPVFQRQIDNLQSLILGEETTKVQNNEAIKQLPITRLQNEASLLGLDSKAAQDQIADAQNRGKEVTKEMYQAAIKTANVESDNLNRQIRKLEKDEQEMIENKTNTADNKKWAENQQALYDTRKAYDELRESVRGWKDEIDGIPLSHLQTEMAGIDRELEIQQRNLDDPSRYAGVADYFAVMETNAEKIVNLQEQIEEKKGQKDQTWQANDPALIQYNSELADLEDQLYSATQAQNEFVKSLANVPTDVISRQLEKYKNELSDLEARLGYKSEIGKDLTDADYNAKIDINKQLAGRTLLSNALLGVQEQIATNRGDQKWLSEIRASKSQGVSDFWGYMGAVFNTKREQKESPLAQLERELGALETAGEQFKNTFDEIERSGRDATAADYTNLQNNIKAQIQKQEQIKEFYEGLRSETDYAENPEDYLKYDQGAMSAESAIASLTQQQYEYNEAVKQIPIQELINQVGGYTDLQREATDIENELNNADAKHVKTNAQLYEKLIKNGDKQIGNLKKQRSEWKNLQKDVKVGSSKWQEYQGEIDNVNNAIDTMQMNQIGWAETMDSLVSTNAASLSSAISSAFSEINSETGLTIDTMNELKRSFSDLAGSDVSNIFYQSADGMKFNIRAAESLIDAEYELQTSNLYDTIEQQKRIIEQQGDAQTENAQKTVAAAEQRIAAAQRELSMLQAQYDQQKQAFSDFAQWQNAGSTANKGDRYTTIQGALKDVQEAYSKGLTGTDEFKTFTSMIDEWGVDTAAAYSRSIEKIKKYFTEDNTGLTNFYKDAVEKGWGTYSEELGYSLAIPDVEQFAHEMDLSQEMVNILLSRAEDYGVFNDWVSTRADGELKLKENMETLTEAQFKYNQMVADGAPQDALENQLNYVKELEEHQANIIENTADVTAREGVVTQKDLRLGFDQYTTLRTDKERGLIDEDTYRQKVQQLSDQFGLILTPDLKIDMQEMNKQYEGWLTVTPKIDWSGIENEQGSEAYNSAVEKVRGEWDQNSDALQGYISTLSEFSEEDLENITLSDGKYNVEGNLIKAEDALQGMANMFGLNKEEAQELLTILKQIGAFNGTSNRQYSTKQAQAVGLVSDYSTNNPETILGGVRESVSNFVHDALTKAEEQKKYEERSEELQPMIDATTDTKTAIDAAGNEIVSAIQNLPNAIANAINGSGEEPEYKMPNHIQTAIENGASIGEAHLAPTQLDTTGIDTSPIQIPVNYEPDTKEADSTKQEMESNPITQEVQLDYQPNDKQNLPKGTTVTNTVTADTSGAENAINSVNSEMSSVATTHNTTFTGDSSDLVSEAEAGKQAADEVPEEKTTHFKAFDAVTGVANGIKNVVSTITGKNIEISASVSGIDALVRMKEAIDNIKSKVVNIISNVFSKKGSDATGTAHVSHATGTAYSMWSDYRHGIGTYANGTQEDWRLPSDEEALVNEFAPNHPESIVRDGRWMIIPGGPHVEQLKKGDII